MRPGFLEPRTKASRKGRMAFKQRISAHGMSHLSARTLCSVAQKQNTAQSAVACDLELEPATMVRILDRMEENGLIERRPDARDRRINLIVRTPIGEEQAALVRSIGEDLRMQIFADVDPKELQNGIALLERVAANVAEAGDIHVPA